MQQWYELLSKIEIYQYKVDEPQEIWTETDWLEFESKTHLILPASYKYFCQVFGTIELNKTQRIYCPNVKFSQKNIAIIKDELEYQIKLGIINETESMLELLDSGFVFGDNCWAHIYLWDMRTYSKLDRSCDIYFLGLDEYPLVLYPMGRNFFEFIHDFCLAAKYHKHLPQHLRPERRRPWVGSRFIISDLWLK